MYCIPILIFLHLKSKHSLFVAMSVSLTVDEDSPGSNNALGSGPGLRLCVRVMSVCVEFPMSLACSGLGRTLGLCPI